MSKIKDYIMSQPNDENIPLDFSCPADFHMAMEQMAFDRITSDVVNLMLSYGYAAVMRDIDSKFSAAHVKAWGQH